MKFISLAAAALFLAASPSLALPPQTLTDRNAGFSIEFPGEAKKESEFNSEIGAQVSVWEYDDYSADVFTFFEFYLVEFPTGWEAHNPREHAAVYARDIVSGSEIMSSKDTTVGNRGGREITARLIPDRIARSYGGVPPQLQYVKVVTIGNRVYIAHARHSENTPATKARNFISSFRTLR